MSNIVQHSVFTFSHKFYYDLHFPDEETGLGEVITFSKSCCKLVMEAAFKLWLSFQKYLA